MDGLFTGLDQNARRISLPPVSYEDARITAQLLSSLDQRPPRDSATTVTMTRHQPWLVAALSDLGECVGEAREEGYPEPTQRALATAESLLRRIARVPVRLPAPNVYPTADHEIDLFFRRGDVGASVLVVIEPDRGGACFSNVGGRRRARHENIDEIMIETIELELKRLSLVGPG